jgi:flagellar assembly protein FliH
LSKKFTSSYSLPEIPQENAFQLEWPQLQPKGYAPSFHRYLQELEEKVLKQTREKSLFIEKEAYEKGFAHGEKDGLELGQRRIETVIHQFQEILLEMERQRKDLHRTFEKEMLQLVLNISKKVIRHELTLHEGVILATLQEALQCVVDQKKIVVHLNPADYQYLLAHPEGLPLTLDEARGVKVIEDHSITRGGCLLETSFGEVDATVESQFEEIVSLIWEQWEQSGQRSDRSNP